MELISKNSRMLPGALNASAKQFVVEKIFSGESFDLVLRDRKPTHSVWVGKFDGKGYPLKGNLTYNSVAYKVVNDRTNDITTWKDGKVAWSGRIEVAKDGKSRTVIINGTGADGKKFKGKAVYNKE